MALAAALHPGAHHTILKGLNAGDIVTIVSNVPFPDGDPEGRQRKVTVLDPMGEQMYILPRLLSNSPVNVHDWNADEHYPAHDLANEILATVTLPEIEPMFIDVEPITADTFADIKDISDPMDPRLDVYRPDPSIVDRYINRIMPNGMMDTDYLLTFTSDAYRAQCEGRPQNIMLKGDSQSGKTMIVQVLAVLWARKLNLPKPMPVFTLNGSSGVTDFDLFGQTTSVEDNLVWLYGLVDLAAKVGGVLYLDEINAMTERVTTSLFSICDHRHQFTNRNKAVYSNGIYLPEIVVAPMDLWIIGTYNEGYKGMGDLTEALVNRFRHIMWDYDKTVEATLIKSPTVRLFGEHLRLNRAKNRLRTPVGTSALRNLEQDIHTFGVTAGLEIIKGMFKAPEREIVQALITEKSIDSLLEAELAPPATPVGSPAPESHGLGDPIPWSTLAANPIPPMASPLRKKKGATPGPLF